MVKEAASAANDRHQRRDADLLRRPCWALTKRENQQPSVATLGVSNLRQRPRSASRRNERKQAIIMFLSVKID